MARSTTACPISRPRRLRSSIRNNLNSLKTSRDLAHHRCTSTSPSVYRDLCTNLLPFPLHAYRSVSRTTISRTLLPTAAVAGRLRVHVNHRNSRFRTSSLNFSCACSQNASGDPQPNVSLEAGISGTMPSRSNRNVCPFQPTPVCASSIITEHLLHFLHSLDHALSITSGGPITNSAGEQNPRSMNEGCRRTDLLSQSMMTTRIRALFPNRGAV